MSIADSMTRVYVGNLDARVTERELEDEFRAFGVLRRYKYDSICLTVHCNFDSLSSCLPFQFTSVVKCIINAVI